MMTSERLLTVEDVASRLQVSLETVRRMLRSGRLVGTQPISQRAGWRVTEGELARFLAAGAPSGGARRPAVPEAGRQSAAVLLANARAQAEQARARGDEDAAARFDRIALGMSAGRQAAGRQAAGRQAAGRQAAGRQA